MQKKKKGLFSLKNLDNSCWKSIQQTEAANIFERYCRPSSKLLTHKNCCCRKVMIRRFALCAFRAAISWQGRKQAAPHTTPNHCCYHAEVNEKHWGTSGNVLLTKTGGRGQGHNHNISNSFRKAMSILTPPFHGWKAGLPMWGYLTK